MPQTRKIFLGSPFYQSVPGSCLLNRDNVTQNHLVWTSLTGNPFLAHNFNTLWSRCLNIRRRGTVAFDYHAMIHIDVNPHTKWWLDIMIEQAESVGADLLHVVLPIKTYHQITSTAVWDPKTNIRRKLTMKEIRELPMVFDGESVGPGLKLLASTGLWICRVNTWWSEKASILKNRLWFEVKDKMVEDEEGDLVPKTSCDDWPFSKKLHDLGLKVYGTRSVVCGHFGEFEFRNDALGGAGALDTDPRPEPIYED